ncbi:hypothetical protein ACFXHA_31305 [Nocardia sp. NPDC059240]|uniref:hypothetical protein n=1 Tax=Nocardia sp. NPDC059240 TaxID=3346786 RepID=UPI0036A552E8
MEYTIQLSREHAELLESLGEVFHAAPERMIEAWTIQQIHAADASLRADHDRPADQGS